MRNIVVPMVGKSSFYDDKQFQFPKPLIEVAGRPMIDRVVEHLGTLSAPRRFIFVINESDAQQYHLDNVLRLLTDESSIIIRQRGETGGAVCTILLAIEFIQNDEPLIIANSDSVIDFDLNQVVDYFESQGADAGTVCFESVHPQWSYVSLDDSGVVNQAAEKCPISKNAIAGFYYFKRGKDFVEAAMNCIEKDVSVNGRYFTSLTFNELILAGKKVVMHKISNDRYFSFYAPEKIKIFEKQANVLARN